jgi:hypothetical protein
VFNAAGAGLTFATLFLIATAGVRSEEAGLASGIISTSQQLGAAVGLAVLATIAASQTSHIVAASGQETHALVAGFQRGLLVAGLLQIAAGLVAVLALRRSDLEQPADAADPVPSPDTEPGDLAIARSNGARAASGDDIVIAFDVPPERDA